MVQQVQAGIKFSLREHWKELFAKDTWFQWQRLLNKDVIVLKRFTLWNVFRWYFFQICLKIVTAILYPILLLAYRYWNDIEEGQDSRVIVRRFLDTMPKISWLRMG